MNIQTCLVTFLAFLTAFPSLADENICSSVIECKTAIIDQGLSRETDKYGMNQEDSRISQATLSLHSDPTEMLVDLLEHPSFGVRRLAAFTLRGVKTIAPKYLADIKRGLDNNTPWLAQALGRIKSHEAAYEAVQRYAISSGAPHNGEAYAVKLSEERAIPFIMDFVRCEEDCPKNHVYNFGYLISDLEVEKNLLVMELLEIITDKSVSEEVLKNTIDILTFMEIDALPAEPSLIKLLNENPNLEQTINNALIRIGTIEGIKLLTESVSSHPAPYDIIELAKNGHRAKSAAPVLLELLDEKDLELNQVIVRALGFIGNPIAAEHLVPMLRNNYDVVLSVLAAQSLAALKSEQSLAALTEVKDTHWYPPVRIAAKDAIDIITGETSASIDGSVFNSYYSMMKSEYLDQTICEQVPLAIIEENEDVKLYQNTSSEKLALLTYDTYILSYGASDETDQILSGNEIIEVTPSNMVEHRTPLEQIPDLALRVDNGWLVGSSRGEWGGELVFVGDDNTEARVLSANIEDIYKLGDSVISTTGLAHMGMNDGMIYKIFKDGNNKWSVTEWIKLPGSPQSSWFVETGELLINVLRGGSILLSENGTMRMAPCSNNQEQ